MELTPRVWARQASISTHSSQLTARPASRCCQGRCGMQHHQHPFTLHFAPFVLPFPVYGDKRNGTEQRAKQPTPYSRKARMQLPPIIIVAGRLSITATVVNKTLQHKVPLLRLDAGVMKGNEAKLVPNVFFRQTKPCCSSPGLAVRWYPTDESSDVSENLLAFAAAPTAARLERTSRISAAALSCA